MAMLAASLAAAGVLAWLAARALLAELGGEPREAAEAARRIAAGDLTGGQQLPQRGARGLLQALLVGGAIGGDSAEGDRAAEREGRQQQHQGEQQEVGAQPPRRAAGACDERH